MSEHSEPETGAYVGHCGGGHGGVLHAQLPLTQSHVSPQPPGLAHPQPSPSG